MNDCRVGDCRESMRAMIAEGVKVQMCVTSPPYWGLRSYGGYEMQILFGDAADFPRPGNARKARTWWVRIRWRAHLRGGIFSLNRKSWIGALGLEPTPELYVEHMVDVFRLVRDLLADDGTLWLNLGDSYNANQGGCFDTNGDGGGRKVGRATPRIKCGRPKDLVGIPWRVAFALQADGWYLRSDIIWHKPNPMPESVTDRPTKAHEYLFLMSKRARYYYDADAIREANQLSDTGWSKSPRTLGEIHGDGQGAQGVKGTHGLTDLQSGRNRRTVWTVATEPYSEAHFATFPQALIEPCILAGSRVGDVIFDPFLGSGTVAQVAQNLGRNWIGCELNEGYQPMQADRARQLGMALA